MYADEILWNRVVCQQACFFPSLAASGAFSQVRFYCSVAQAGLLFGNAIASMFSTSSPQLYLATGFSCYARGENTAPSEHWLRCGIEKGQKTLIILETMKHFSIFFNIFVCVCVKQI